MPSRNSLGRTWTDRLIPSIFLLSCILSPNLSDSMALAGIACQEESVVYFHNTVGRSISGGRYEYDSTADASHDRCHDCPKLNDSRFTTVRWRKGWQRFYSCRINARETLVVGDVKCYQPKGSKWNQAIRKLKRFLGKVGYREAYAQKFEGQYGKRLGNVSTAAVWPFKPPNPHRLLFPKFQFGRGEILLRFFL